MKFLFKVCIWNYLYIPIVLNLQRFTVFLFLLCYLFFIYLSMFLICLKFIVSFCILIIFQVFIEYSFSASEYYFQSYIMDFFERIAMTFKLLLLKRYPFASKHYCITNKNDSNLNFAFGIP